MASAHDVANLLILLAQSAEEPDYLTPLRLQKLLYYVQGWSLANRKKPMFSDRIEAWAHGPVVPAVYLKNGNGSEKTLSWKNGKPIPLTEEEHEFVAQVWDAYKEHSALSLREMTHREMPWVQAREGVDPGEACHVEITHDTLRSYFGKRGSKR